MRVALLNYSHLPSNSRLANHTTQFHPSSQFYLRFDDYATNDDATNFDDNDDAGNSVDTIMRRLKKKRVQK